MGDGAWRTPAPDSVRETEPGRGSPSAIAQADELLGGMGELRARFEAAQADILNELRNLRSENARLREENRRWKTLVGEYKQILSGG